MDQYCYSALNLGEFLHKALAFFCILYERKRPTNCAQHVLPEQGIPYAEYGSCWQGQDLVCYYRLAHFS